MEQKQALLTVEVAPKDYIAAIAAPVMAAGWGDWLDHFPNLLHLLNI